MITDSFDKKSKPIISLKDIYGEQKHLTDICIITFSEFIYKAIIESYECEPIAKIGACNGSIPIYSFHDKGRIIAFYLSPIGSTAASQCLLEANWLIGATKFVMFGSSGSLAYEKTMNRFVIPTEAYRDEGMSYHYAPPGDYITVKTVVSSELFLMKSMCLMSKERPGRPMQYCVKPPIRWQNAEPKDVSLWKWK